MDSEDRFLVVCADHEKLAMQGSIIDLDKEIIAAEQEIRALNNKVYGLKSSRDRQSQKYMDISNAVSVLEADDEDAKKQARATISHLTAFTFGTAGF